MIQIFQTSGKRLVEQSNEFSGGINIRNKWIHLENPTDREIELMERITGVSEDMLKAALDVEERARIETDEGDTLVLDTAKRENFLYQMLYNTHVKFLQYLRQIDRSWQRIQVELHRSTKNKELIQLLDLENSLVYFSASLRANSLIIERLMRSNSVKSEEDAELLEDVGIENRQAVDMCNIYRDILSGTMDAYASIISNNVNSIMKLLTVITLIISIPTLFASLWGMNTGVPFEGQKYGFYVVTGISLVIAGVAGYYLLRTKKEKNVEELRKVIRRRNKKT